MFIKPKTLLLAGTTILFVVALVVGQYHTPRSGDREFFIKHSLTLKQYFYSPSAQYRFMPRTLSPTERKDEVAFQKIVTPVWIDGVQSLLLASILIQMSLTLLIWGCYSLFTKKSIKAWKIFLHSFIGTFITLFCLGFMLLLDAAVSSIIIVVVIFSTNFLIVDLLNKLEKRLRSKTATI